MAEPSVDSLVSETSAAPQATRRLPWECQTTIPTGDTQTTTSWSGMPPSENKVPASLLPGGKHSLAGVSFRAFALGSMFGGSTAAALYLLIYSSPLWRAPFFLAILSLFHFLEFLTTAYYNTDVATTSAFLLSSNGVAYNAAHTFAMLETLLSHSLFTYPSYIPESVYPYLLSFGLILLAIGQSTRTAAMIRAGKNFNHTVQVKKATAHELVTSGVYALLRHPSYFGFFWWGLGSQIVLGNPICFMIYALVLWKFFSSRIQKEEGLLLKFFGSDYELYRKGTYVAIPFIQ